MMKACADFHSHILPCVDDGSHSVEESLQMLRMEAEQGVTHVVLTPHFYAKHDSPERFLQRRAAAWETLQAAMAGEEGLPQINLGAEVYYFPGISESEAVLRLTVGDSRFLMLEMPAMPWTESMYREIAAIHQRYGLTPIIAHIDRYIGPFRTHGVLKRLEQLPVLIQANGSFFLQSGTARMAMRMLRKKQVHLLGSDCHNLQERRPNLGETVAKIEKQLGSEALAWIRSCENIVLSHR